MSEETKPTPPASEETLPTPPRRALSDPQILAAIITGVVSVIVAVLGIVPVVISSMPKPTVTPSYTPTSLATTVLAIIPTSTGTEIVASSTSAPTLVPASATPTTSTSTPLPQFGATTTTSASATPSTEPVMVVTVPTLAPTTTTPVPTQPTLESNLLLMFDEVSFTAINTSGRTLSLEGVAFVSDSGRWDAIGWGGNVHDRLPDDNCLRLRDLAASPRNPPGECKTLFGLMVVGEQVLFWRDVESFEVVRNGDVIATCATSAAACEVLIPQER
jgi:hypothetical protein